MTAPTVSVIMAAYNGTAFVRETIDSLRAQSFADFELIVVDDCSTDDTLAMLRGIDDPRLTVIAATENGGPVRARNRAFEAARGRYVAGLDQDDLCRPERLARQVAFLDAHPDTVLVTTSTIRLEDGVLLPLREPLATTPDLIDWLMRFRNPLAWSSTMFRADAARRLVPFTRPDMLYVEDFDLYHRLRPFGRIARIDAPLTVYRIHPGGVSKRYEAIMVANLVRLLAEVHAPLFGATARADAALLVRHVNEGVPAPDAATLWRLLAVIARLHETFLAGRTLDPVSARLIAREHARLWRTVARAAVRARTVRLREALALRPHDVPRAHAGYPDLFVSPMIGRVRALAARP